MKKIKELNDRLALLKEIFQNKEIIIEENGKLIELNQNPIKLKNSLFFEKNMI